MKILRNKKHENNLVYKFKCSECPSAYIGETARRLEDFESV